MERIKEFSRFVVLVKLSKVHYWMKLLTTEQLDGIEVKTRKGIGASLREFFSVKFPDKVTSTSSPSQKKRPTNAHPSGPMKTISCNGHTYDLDRQAAFTLHGWYPFLKENRWNAWRQVYNMLYRYFISVGLLYYEDPDPVKKSKDSKNNSEEIIHPMTWTVAEEKWTPGLVQAVNLSRLEERYNKHINFGSFTISWKVALVLGVVAIVILLFLTGRLPL